MELFPAILNFLDLCSTFYAPLPMSSFAEKRLWLIDAACLKCHKPSDTVKIEDGTKALNYQYFDSNWNKQVLEFQSERFVPVKCDKPGQGIGRPRWLWNFKFKKRIFLKKIGNKNTYNHDDLKLKKQNCPTKQRK